MNNLSNSGDLPLPEPTAAVAATVGKAQCGELATVQIEIYAQHDGHAHGSLDGVLRMCAKHDADLTEVIGWDTSDPKPTIYRKPVTRPGVPCGSGYDFVAGQAIPPFTPELKARHAFTPSRIEGTMDDWLWQCTCGEQFIQREGERIHVTLNAHARGES